LKNPGRHREQTMADDQAIFARENQIHQRPSLTATLGASIMQNTVFARLFGGLDTLIPNLQDARAGAVFYAPPRGKNEHAMFCSVSQVDGDMRLIELADDRVQRDGEIVPAPWLKLRVDMSNKIAEVLEMEYGNGYEAVYTGGKTVNPQRALINLFAVNWLQAMVNFELAFLSTDMPVAA
jgi:hypothetical protein